jgi:hypothetical protein
MDPILDGYGKPISLRIILIGNIYRDGQVTEEQVAAYLDVELKP